MGCDSLRVAQFILAAEHTRNQSGIPLPICCRHRGKHSELLSRMSNCRNSSKDNASNTPEPLRNGTSGYALPRWQTIENEWTNFTLLDRVTYKTCGCVFLTDYDCFRLTQHIQTVFHVVKQHTGLYGMPLRHISSRFIRNTFKCNKLR